MSGPYDRDDREEIDERAPADREISLGTGAMLGIFFALVLVCGAFFGFGYSLGHKSPPVSSVATADADAPAVSAGPTGAAPTEAPSVVVAPTPAPKASAGRLAAAPVVKSPAVTASAVDAATAPTAPAGTRTPTKPFITVPTTAPPATAAVPAVAAPAASPGGTVYVQISAVSHQEDAQSLVSALKRRGYEATVRHEAQDQLLHIQLGPYATKKDADAMKLRLSADGYNAILK